MNMQEKMHNCELYFPNDEDIMKETAPTTDFTDIKRSHWAYYEIMEAATRHYENEWH